MPKLAANSDTQARQNMLDELHARSSQENALLESGSPKLLSPEEAARRCC